MQWIRSHMSFANVMSLMALFVALGGTSVAAISLSKNSVGTKQIKKNGVRAIDISRNAVGASEIRSNAVAGGDVADGTLGTLDLADGSVITGKLADNSVLAPKVADNAVGSSEIASNAVGSGEVTDGSLGANDLQPGLLDLNLIARRTDFNLPAGPTPGNPGPEVDGFETCEPGETIIGGSVNTSSPAGATTLISRPSTDTVGNGGIPDDEAFAAWKGTARTNTNVAATMRVFAICASAPATP